MIVLMITLWSLCAIYITRFLFNRNMKIAAGLYTVLYVYLLAWIFTTFCIDYAEYGFRATQLSFLHGSNLYHDFAHVTDVFATLPTQFLFSILMACVVIIAMAFTVIVMGVHGIYKELKRIGKTAVVRIKHRTGTVYVSINNCIYQRLYLKNCRLNC